MKYLIRLAFSAAALIQCVSAQPANSQITGRITDSTGSVVPSVPVTAINTGTRVQYEGVSNESGYYSIPLLPPGEYRVEAHKQSFRAVSRSGITLEVGQTARIDFTLEVGSVNETVNVLAAAPLVDTDTSTVGAVIDNRKITQLPLNGRNVYSLMTLVPGAAPDNTGRVRINGARNRGNEILTDGVTQMAPETRADPIAPPPIDSIQEFKLSTSNYSAEFGNASGGLVNIVTRSGTNDFHGTLWEFLRNDKLNTRNFFASPTQPKPVLRQNQYGAAGGGPVWLPHLYDGHNRTFFFADFENTPRRQQTVNNISVPTAGMRSGDFSSFLGSAIGTDVLGRTVLQGQIYDPASQRTVNGQTARDPFAGNVIPRARFDPIALKLLDYWPTATNNQLTQNFLRATPSGTDTSRFDVRGDHNLSTGNRLFARYSDYTQTPVSNVPFRGATGDYDVNETKQRSVTGSWISTLTPSTLSELRLSFLKSSIDRRPYLSDTNGGALLGIPNITTVSGLPYIDISGVNGIGGNVSGGFYQNAQRVYSIVENISLIRGKHSFRTGGEIRFYRMKNFQPTLLNGAFSFRSDQTSLPGTLQTRTGNAFASFLLGQANQSQYTQKDPGQLINGETYALFFQDDWKLSTRLTLNLGLRYELNTRLHDKRGYSSTFDVASGRVLAGGARPEVPLDRNNFGPRIGFAYDVRGDHKTVVRGGFGIFYQPIVGGGGNPLQGIPKFPFEFTSNAISPNGLDPVTTLSAGPVRQTEYSLTDPRLGFGTDVLVQPPNTAPYAEQWNLSVERGIGASLLVSAAYVASGGRKLDTGRTGYININQVPIAVARQAARDQGTLNPNTASLKPWPDFNLVNLINPRYGNSNYNSLQLKAEQRLRGGVSYLISYTWSKNIDNGSEVFNFSGGSWPQDIYNLRLERAVSTADVPQRFVAAYVLDLPFGAGRRFAMHGFWNALAGGWQLSGITSFNSGRPVDVEQSTNTTRTFSLLQRPNISGNPILPNSQRTLDRFFDTSKFSPADPLSFGTSPRNPIRGPGLSNTDLSVNKQWTWSERWQLEFRAEAFNFTNTPPFQLETRTTYNPALALNQQSFGRITQAGDGRVLQFGLKLRF